MIRESEDLPEREDKPWEKCLSLVVSVDKKGISPDRILIDPGIFFGD
jgi:hypothetical protein